MEGKMSRQQFIQYSRCRRGESTRIARKRPKIASFGVKYLYLGWLTFNERRGRSA